MAYPERAFSPSTAATKLVCTPAHTDPVSRAKTSSQHHISGNANSFSWPRRHIPGDDLGPAADGGHSRSNVPCKWASGCAHPGVVDAAVVAVAKHHAGVDHGRELRQHRAPAVALDVDEAQQLRVLNVAEELYQVLCLSHAWSGGSDVVGEHACLTSIALAGPAQHTVRTVRGGSTLRSDSTINTAGG